MFGFDDKMKCILPDIVRKCTIVRVFVSKLRKRSKFMKNDERSAKPMWLKTSTKYILDLEEKIIKTLNKEDCRHAYLKPIISLKLLKMWCETKLCRVDKGKS